MQDYLRTAQIVLQINSHCRDRQDNHNSTGERNSYQAREVSISWRALTQCPQYIQLLRPPSYNSRAKTNLVTKTNACSVSEVYDSLVKWWLEGFHITGKFVPFRLYNTIFHWLDEFSMLQYVALGFYSYYIRRLVHRMRVPVASGNS